MCTSVALVYLWHLQPVGRHEQLEHAIFRHIHLATDIETNKAISMLTPKAASMGDQVRNTNGPSYSVHCYRIIHVPALTLPT
jgi:hypothetical protein